MRRFTTCRWFLALTLAVLLVLLDPAPAAARDDFGKVYPYEIAPALISPETASPESLALLESVCRPTSLGITMPNVAVGKVHCTRPLYFFETLRDLGYSDEQLAQMDFGDYENIMDNTPLKACAYIDYLDAERYPELTGGWVFSLTYGNIYGFEAARRMTIRIPSINQVARLAARGLTLSDADWLKGLFWDYDSILAQDDATLKKALESRYQWNIDYVLSLPMTGQDKPPLPQPANPPLTCLVYNGQGQQIAVGKIIDGEVCMPMRLLFDACGASFDWQREGQLVRVRTADGSREIFIDPIARRAELYQDGQSQELELNFDHYFVEQFVAFLPAEPLAAALGCPVQWDGEKMYIGE